MKNILTGALLLALVAAFWIQRAYKYEHTNLLPDAAMVVLAALSLLLVVTGWRHRQREEDQEEQALRLADLGRAVVLLAAWIVALQPLGFVVSGIVFATAISITMRTERRTLRGLGLDLAVNAGVVIAVYLAFTQVLYVRLPEFGGM